MSNDTNWRLRGKCLDVDPDVMHPDPGNRYGNEKAKEICLGCPVATECFINAVELRDWNGTRAGMSGEERWRWAVEHVPGVKPTKRVPV